MLWEIVALKYALEKCLPKCMLYNNKCEKYYLFTKVHGRNIYLTFIKAYYIKADINNYFSQKLSKILKNISSSD